MLLGEFRHSMDAKNRVHVPARWRNQLGEGIVLVQGLERCVAVYPASEFQKLTERIDALSETRRQNRDYARLVYGSAAEETLDGQGRITVPQNLREWAGLSREVVMAGIRNRAEIWDRDAWSAYRSQKEPQFEDIAEELEL